MKHFKSFATFVKLTFANKLFDEYSNESSKLLLWISEAFSHKHPLCLVQQLFNLKPHQPSRQPLLDCEAFRFTQPSFWATSPTFFLFSRSFSAFRFICPLLLEYLFAWENFLDDFRLCKFLLNGHSRKNYWLDFPGSAFVNNFPQVVSLFSSFELQLLS